MWRSQSLWCQKVRNEVQVIAVFREWLAHNGSGAPSGYRA